MPWEGSRLKLNVYSGPWINFPLVLPPCLPVWVLYTSVRGCLIASIMTQSLFFLETVGSYFFCFNCVSFFSGKRESSSDVHVCIFFFFLTYTANMLFSLPSVLFWGETAERRFLPLLLPPSVRLKNQALCNFFFFSSQNNQFFFWPHSIDKKNIYKVWVILQQITPLFGKFMDGVIYSDRVCVLDCHPRLWLLSSFPFILGQIQSGGGEYDVCH